MVPRKTGLHRSEGVTLRGYEPEAGFPAPLRGEEYLGSIRRPFGMIVDGGVCGDLDRLRRKVSGQHKADHNACKQCRTPRPTFFILVLLSRSRNHHTVAK